MDKAKELPTKTDGKKEGVDFLVPYLSCVYLQLSPSYENRKNAERYTGKLPFKRMLLLRIVRDSYHPHAHWLAVLNKYWRHHASHLCQLIVNDLEMAEEKYDMDIQPLLPHSDAIIYLGQDYKASVPVGRSVPLADVGNKSDRGIVGQYQIVVAADRYWHADKMVPSVKNHINITETDGESLYSGGTNGLGRIFSWFTMQPPILQLNSNILQMYMRY